MSVDVEQARYSGIQCVQSCHDRERDRAVATEHQHTVASREQWAEAIGELPQTGDHLLGVLRVGLCAIRRPYLGRKVSVVVDLESGAHEGANQSCPPEGGGRLVLPGGVATSAVGDSYD
ncbi:MAG: hypothetical protein WBF51_03580 [Candidatus Dormiibacterota bacterium]